MHCPATLQVVKLSGEAPPQVVNQPFKHLAKVTILKFEYVDVHEQPEVMVIVHHFLDLPAEPDKGLWFQWLVDLVEDRTQAAIDGRLVFADD